MGIRYEHLLSPLQVGNVILKNRMVATAGIPHLIQGAEDYPTEKLITHLTNRAKNGASAVFLNFFMGAGPGSGHAQKDEGYKELYDMDLGFQSHDNTSRINLSTVSSHNYICQLIDAIRYYESVAITQPSGTYKREMGPGGPPMGGMGDGFERSDPIRQLQMEKENCYGHPVDNITNAQIQEYIDSTVKNAVVLKDLGFEMFSIHNAYHNSLTSEFWSELCNHRTDEYGGSVKGRARLFLELFDALRQTLGRDFPLETLISAEGPGVSIRDSIELAKMSEGLVDIFHIRHGLKDPQHPVGYTSSREIPCPNLAAASALKQALMDCGSKILVGVSAGLQNPDFNEMIIREKKADIICMSRAWICDSEYGRKVYEGRGEDITPCIRCNKCHVPNSTDMFRSFCSVNPKIGREQKLDQVIEPAGIKKNVAVVGGGPAGLEAALIAAQRGHSVTLYEKTGRLGGQLFHADYPSFKWPLADFRDYLIHQVCKAGVTVMLNTAATGELLAPEGYDEVIVAVGPSFTRPSIPGAEKAMLAIDVYGREAELPNKIVIVGGSETGTETGMYLAENGHNVTVMTRQGMLSADAAHAHYVVMQMDAYDEMDNFKYHRYVRKYLSIDEGGVDFIDEHGNRQREDADLVVISGGVEPMPAEAISFYGAGKRTHYIGDCVRAGDVHKAVTSGFAVANQI